ncbi:MAG: hypothetical protein GY908_01565 [Flavobacteriales bacterium]|nr:hypothetical protein [Flavobacteriales bacterium]
MKKLLLLSTPVLLVFLLSGFNTLKNDDVPSKILGSWEYIAPTMGFKYHKGALKFNYEQEVLTGVVILEDRIIPMRKLIYNDNKVRAYVMFEGQQIDIFLRFDKDSFKGTVSHPQGYIRISGNKTSI